MKITLFCSKVPGSGAIYGGAETSILLIGHLLQKKGHEVFILTKKAKGFIPGLHSYLEKNLQFVQPVVLKGEVKIPFIKRLNQLLESWFLTKFIKKNQIDHVYLSYHPSVLKKLLRGKTKQTSFKIIMRMAGLRWYEDCLKNATLIHEYQNVFNNVDGINFIHEGLKRMVNEKFQELNINITQPKFMTYDIGSSYLFYRYRGREYRVTPGKCDEIKLLCVMRFSAYQKRQDILVEAINSLPPNSPFKLNFIGEGKRKTEIQNQINPEIRDKVNFLGFLSQDALWDEMESADLLCHPCDYEGLGKTVVESLSMGLPVLGSKDAPLIDYIEDFENGFLVQNDPKAWQQKLKKLFQENDLLEHVSIKAKDYALSHFDPYKNVAFYENDLS